MCTAGNGAKLQIALIVRVLETQNASVHAICIMMFIVLCRLWSWASVIYMVLDTKCDIIHSYNDENSL
jgi:hypothetical protein